MIHDDSTFPAVVILGALEYNSHIQSTSVNTAKYLSEQTRVFYIENPLTYKDVIRRAANGRGNLSRRNSFIELHPNLIVATPPSMLSINFLPEGRIYRSLLQVNERRLARFIRKTLTHFGIKEFIFINSFNFHYPGTGGLLRPSLNIYQCVDPLIIPFDIRHGVISERQLCLDCDLIFCTSKALYEEKKQLNPHTHFIPNAADVNHFIQAMSPHTPAYPGIRTEDGMPVIGYIGAIERRIDYDLLRVLIETNPNKKFVFAGPVSRTHVPDWFFEAANLELLGAIDYQDLPSLIKAFDICLIPFKTDDVSRTIFPLKLFEFLGSGKPIIATDFNPDLKDYTGQCVYYSHDARDITARIEAILSTNSNDVTGQLQIAKSNTWEARIAQIMTIIRNHPVKTNVPLR